MVHILYQLLRADPDSDSDSDTDSDSDSNSDLALLQATRTVQLQKRDRRRDAGIDAGCIRTYSRLLSHTLNVAPPVRRDEPLALARTVPRAGAPACLVRLAGWGARVCGADGDGDGDVRV